MADFLIALTDFYRFAREERFQADVVPDAACAKHCVDRGSYGSYHRLMRSVGVKALKNNLSRYLDLVRQGEVVLVTDRDEVVAELRLPSQPHVTRASPWMAFLEEQARRGVLRLARRKRSRLEPPATGSGAAAGELLREARSERF